jgi:hypothetical protein
LINQEYDNKVKNQPRKATQVKAKPRKSKQSEQAEATQSHAKPRKAKQPFKSF